MISKEKEDKELSNELSANLLMEAKSLLGKQENAIIEMDNRNARQKISDTLEEYAFSLWYRGIDDLYARMLLEKMFTFHNGAKPTKADEVLLKYIWELAAVKWYKDANREFVIQTNIKQLDSNQILKS